MAALRRKALSKVNLHLAVKGRRPDGYHEIETLFFPLEEPFDEISVEPSEALGIDVECDSPSVPGGMDNLCGKAAAAYCEAANVKAAFKIYIKKRIPVAAGMGGGSSDAAAALLLLRDAFGGIDDAALRRIALGLGADVPFFLNAEPSIGKGVGEELSPVGGVPPRIPLLVVAPLFPVSAAWAYKNIDWEAAKADRRAVGELLKALGSQDFPKAGALLRNDLSHAVREKFPLIRMMEERLLSLGACGVQMSGSGPTVFALFEDFKKRDEAKSLFWAGFEGEGGSLPSWALF